MAFTRKKKTSRISWTGSSSRIKPRCRSLQRESSSRTSREFYRVHVNASPLCCKTFFRTKMKQSLIIFLLLVSFDSGIPAMVDLAAMRDAVAKHGVDPSLVNPKCPTDLIVDHSLQIDYSKWCVSVCIFSIDIKWVLFISQANTLIFLFLNVFVHSAIQNAPNPGGGGDGPNQSQGPSRSTPSRPPSRGGSQCGSQRGSCSKAACSDPPASPGRPPASVQQIENTPLLCPFHLKPVSE